MGNTCCMWTTCWWTWRWHMSKGHRFRYALVCRNSYSLLQVSSCLWTMGFELRSHPYKIDDQPSYVSIYCVNVNLQQLNHLETMAEPGDHVIPQPTPKDGNLLSCVRSHHHIYSLIRAPINPSNAGHTHTIRAPLGLLIESHEPSFRLFLFVQLFKRA